MIKQEPRLLSKTQAANYCGYSIAIFDQICPVLALEMFADRPRLNRYDVVDIDKWIESKKDSKKNDNLNLDDYIGMLGNG